MLSHVGEDQRRDQFTVRRCEHNGAVVLQVSGTIDAVTAPTLASHLDAALAGAPTLVIVDLRRVDLLSAAGITVLVETQHLAQQGPTTLRVVARGRATSRLMHLTGVSDEIDLYPTLNAARRKENR